jgi:hypothetical protein
MAGGAWFTLLHQSRRSDTAMRPVRRAGVARGRPRGRSSTDVQEERVMTERQPLAPDQRARRHALAADATQRGGIDGGGGPPGAVARRALADPRGPTPGAVLRLQRAVGNRATGRLVTGARADAIAAAADARVARRSASVSPGSAAGHLVQRVKNEGEVFEVKKRREGTFLREILEGLTCGLWSFPKQHSGDGIIGKNCISAGVVYQVPKAKKGLCYHVNFMISAGTMAKSTPARRGRLVLSLSLLHLTARADGTQALIVEDGPSILTAAKSIHCGPGNDWDWKDERAKELAIDLGCEVTDIQNSMSNTGLGKPSMAALRGPLKAAIIATVNGHLPNIDVEWGDVDSTWA